MVFEQNFITEKYITDKYITVGHIKDAHSLKGEVYVYLKAGKADWLPKVRSIRLSKNNKTQDMHILKAKPHKHGLIVQFEGIQDRTQAEELRGFKFAIPESALISDPADEGMFLHEILGFSVFDQNDQMIGEITSFATNGKQDLLVVTNGSSPAKVEEILIPFVEDFLEKMDWDARRIHMHLPLGLLEVNKPGSLRS